MRYTGGDIEFYKDTPQVLLVMESGLQLSGMAVITRPAGPLTGSFADRRAFSCVFHLK